MLKTVYRISIMYFVSIFLMRVAGKREVAQLEVSELVTSFMVSEIACMPITDPDVALGDAVVFSAVVIILEVLLTKISLKMPFFKHMIVGKPDFIIVNGKLDKKVLNSSGVSLSELVSAMRRCSITSIEKINYAVQEPDGTISIIPYIELPEAEVKENKAGLQHMIICDGRINKSEAKRFGYTKEKISSIVKQNGIACIKEVFFLGIDDMGEVFIIEK